MPADALLPGVRSRDVRTRRLRVHWIESGPANGSPVVLVHGNLSSGRIFEHLMPLAPRSLRLIAPDMRGFGDTDPLPLDATRGLADWADDVRALLDALEIDQPAHLAGWSAGAPAVAAYALAGHPVASLTLIAANSPYGFGGVRPDGRPCQPDFAGSGGGIGSAGLAGRIAAGDRAAGPLPAPRAALNDNWAPGFRLPPAREELLLGELLKARTGPDGYPGDAVPSDNWPGTAPGTRGILNAISPKYCTWDEIVDLAPKPPVLWVHGALDRTCADGSVHEPGMRGQIGDLPGWPGPEAFPPQPMVTQLRTVLTRYRDAGGCVHTEWFEDSGHAPHVDAAERFAEVFFGFLLRHSSSRST